MYPPPNRTLLGPGPSNVHPEVLNAMSQPLVGHLDPWFLEFMNGLQSKLRRLFRTRNEMTLPISGTGSAGMECCFTNLCEPGDDVLICINGVFGNRMVDVAKRCGANVKVIQADWGKPIDVEMIELKAKLWKPKLIAIVHAETSTGVMQPNLKEIGKIAHDHGALFLVDAVTSLGGIDVRVDDWGIDAIYSGTQKCLSAPPGLSPVSFSPGAMSVIANRKTKCQSWYLDIGMLASYWGEDRVYHHTAPITALYGLDTAVNEVLCEGLGHCFSRHRGCHLRLAEYMAELEFGWLVDEAYRLPQLNAVTVPPGINEAKIRANLLHNHGIEVGGGLGDLKGKVWRIGLMGYSAQPKNVVDLSIALHKELKG